MESRYIVQNGQLEVRGYSELFDGGAPNDVLVCEECKKEFTRAQVLDATGDVKTCPECDGDLFKPEEDESDTD